MKSLVQKLLLLSLAVAIALPLAAQDKEKKKNKKGGDSGVVAQLKKAIADLDLKDDQKTKIAAAFAEYGPKLSEAAKAAGDAPRRMQEAKKKLSDEGKKGKDLAAAVKDTVKLSAEEQTAVDKLEGLGKDLRSAVSAVLTDEQKEKAGLNKGKKKKNA